MTDPKKIFANVDFSFIRNEEKSKFLERQELAYKYFFQLNKGSKILNDSKALVALDLTFKSALKSGYTEQIDISLKYDFTRILVSILENSYQKLLDCIKRDDLYEDDEINQKIKLVV